MGSISKLASEYLSTEVETAAREVERITDQIRELEARRDAVKLKIEALRPLLGSDLAAQVARLHRTGVAASDGAAAPQDSGGDKPASGFRESIRAILQESAKGLRPREIALEMKARQVPYKGRVELSTRVGNELYRMLKSGQVRRRAGRYLSANAGGAET